MRILMAGDTHGDLVHVRYLLQVAQQERCDCIFVLGDFGYWEHEPEGGRFLDRVNTNANMKNVPVYFLDGNHDKTSLLLEKYDHEVYQDNEGFLIVRDYVRYARRGHQWSWDDVGFMALGGAYSVDKQSRLERETKSGKPGSLWFPEEEMTDEELDDYLVQTPIRDVDVILAHDMPRAASPGWNRKHFDECIPNQRRLQHAMQVLKPVLYLHGHLHYRYTDRVGIWADGEPGTIEHDCIVEGLDCNTNDQQAYVLYGKTGGGPASWYVLDTEYVKTLPEED